MDSLEFDVQKLIKIRDDRLLSTAEFAKELEIQPSTVMRWEKGMKPSRRSIRSIAERLGVEPHDLMKPKKGRK